MIGREGEIIRVALDEHADDGRSVKRRRAAGRRARSGADDGPERTIRPGRERGVPEPALAAVRSVRRHVDVVHLEVERLREGRGHGRAARGRRPFSPAETQSPLGWHIRLEPEDIRVRERVVMAGGQELDPVAGPQASGLPRAVRRPDALHGRRVAQRERPAARREADGGRVDVRQVPARRRELGADHDDRAMARDLDPHGRRVESAHQFRSATAPGPRAR